MAYFRQIHVRIWKDEWFGELNPKQKLLFVYLFSNEQVSLSGIYELSLRVICFETGLSQKDVLGIMDVFAAAGKAYYKDSVVWIPSLPRYQSSQSEKVRLRMMRDVLMLKDCVLKEEYCKLYGIDRVSEDENRVYDSDGTVSVPSFILSSSLVSSSLKESANGESSEKKNDSPGFEDVSTAWKKYFPKKSQPRPDNKPLKNKLATRRKDGYFRDKWEVAMARASKSPFLQESNWFTLGWFLKNPENWEKCLDGNYDGKQGTKQKAEQYTKEQKDHVEGSSFQM
jgi:hypothetical protein